MKEIFEITAAILASLGGGTAIVFGLSSWLGKVWANRILAKEKAEHSKELEFYKSELNKELERINVLQDKALYISKVQYDNEYKIYQEIWEEMHRIMMMVQEFCCENRYNRLDWATKVSKFADKIVEFEFLIEKYSLFYQEEFISNFYQIISLSYNVVNKFKAYQENNIIEINTLKSDELFEEYHKVTNYITSVKVKIKKYLHSLVLR